METITDESIKISVMLLDKTPNSDGTYFVAVSFRIKTRGHLYPATCILDFLDMDAIEELLEEPKHYAFNGGRASEK